jgi:hypothetical protein
LPIKWVLAMSLRTLKYVFMVMGIPCNFNKKNGMRINRIGITSVITGDNKCIIERDCRKEVDVFKYFNISHSIKEYFSKKYLSLFTESHTSMTSLY